MDYMAFQRCLQELHPKLDNHLREVGVVLQPITCTWFLSLFVGVLPMYGACRVWDSLFFEGDIVLFRVALKLLHLKKSELLVAEDTLSCYTVLKSSSHDTHSTFTLPKPPKSRNTNYAVKKHTWGLAEEGDETILNTSSESMGRVLEDRRGATSPGLEEIDGTEREDGSPGNGADSHNIGSGHNRQGMSISSVSYLMEKSHKVPLTREKLYALREDALEAILAERAGDESILRRSSVVNNEVLRGDQSINMRSEVWGSSISGPSYKASLSMYKGGGGLPNDFMETMNLTDDSTMPKSPERPTFENGLRKSSEGIFEEDSDLLISYEYRPRAMASAGSQNAPLSRLRSPSGLGIRRSSGQSDKEECLPDEDDESYASESDTSTQPDTSRASAITGKVNELSSLAGNEDNKGVTDVDLNQKDDRKDEDDGQVDGQDNGQDDVQDDDLDDDLDDEFDIAIDGEKLGIRGVKNRRKNSENRASWRLVFKNLLNSGKQSEGKTEEAQTGLEESEQEL